MGTSCNTDPINRPTQADPGEINPIPYMIWQEPFSMGQHAGDIAPIEAPFGQCFYRLVI